METPVIENEEDFEGEDLNAAEETLEDVKRVINGDVPIFTPPKKIVRKVMDESEKAETEIIPEKKPKYEPYPGFDPKKPDPEFAYTGVLFRVTGSGTPNYLERIDGRTFDDVAYRYGAGNYMIRMPNMKGICMYFPVSRELETRVRFERQDEPEDFYFEKNPKADSQAVPAPVQNGDSKIYELLLQQSQQTQAQFQTMLMTLLGKDTGASGQALSDAYQNGFKAGQESAKTAMGTMDTMFKNIEKERDEWKGKAEMLQVELGQLPSDEEEEEDEETEEQPKSALTEVVEGLKAVKDLVNSKPQDTAPENRQIENQQKEIRVMNSDNIKNLIVNSFKNQVPALQAAQQVFALVGSLEKGALKAFPATQVVDYLVQNYLPGAAKELISYLTAIVGEMKKF